MKKTLSLLLVLAMVLSSFGFAFAAKDEVKPAEFLNEKGILKGNASGDLMLEDNLKRQDMIVMLSRLLGVEKEAKAYEGETSFKDVVDPFYVPYVAWAEANELTNGKAEGKFGFDEFVTEQQVAQFMLRALGYGEVAWDEVPAKAVALKLVEKDTDLSVDAKRSVLAEITYKALGTKMKDSDKTLAEFLKIEMPAPKELKVEKVYTENLREVVVELSNAKLVNEEKLADANNYKLVGNVVQKATVEENTVTILLKDALIKGKDYELIIRGIDKAINGKHDFTAKDNTIPAVENVEVLGEYGIKVTTTEPIKDVRERNFLVDGKNVAMVVEQYGRHIILTPYYKASFSESAEKLTVKGLEDYAGYKSVQEDFEIKVVKDEVAPKVVDVIARGNKVEVVFDKDIYNDSVEGYYSRVSVGNISYEAGRHSVYAEDAEKVDTNKVVYTFKDELPRRTVVTIVDVANHSKVAMEKTTIEARVVVDDSEPELIDKKVYTDPSGEVTIKLYFDKDVKGSFKDPKDVTKGFEVKDHFTLYEREVLKRNILEDKIISAEYAKDRKDVIVVELEGLKVNNKDKDYNYILEVVDFVDVASSRNKMYRDYVDFDVKAAGTDFTVKDVTVVEGKAKTEITILFNKAVDRVIAEDSTNYIFTDIYNDRYDVKDLDGEIITEYNGKEVTLVIPEFDPADFKDLRILDTLKDKDGNRLDVVSTYVFGTNYVAFVKRAEKAEGKGTELGIDAKVLKALTDLKPYNDTKKHNEILKAVEDVEELIEKAEKANKDDVAVAKKELGKLVAEAKDVYAKLENKDSNEAKALAEEMAKAEILLAKEDATLDEIGETATAGQRGKLNTKLEAAKTQLAEENKTGVGYSTQTVTEGTNDTATQIAKPATPVIATITISGTATDGTATIKLGENTLAEATLASASDDSIGKIANKLAEGVKEEYEVDATAADTGKLVFTAKQAGVTNYNDSDVTISSEGSTVIGSGSVVNGKDAIPQIIEPATKAKVVLNVDVSYTDGKTKVGKIKVSLAGKDVEVEIPAGKTAAEVAELITTAVNADTGFEYTATVSGAAVTFEAKVAGATSLGTNPVTIAEVQ